MVPTGWFPRHRDGAQPLLSLLIYTRNKVKNQGIAQAISAALKGRRPRASEAPPYPENNSGPGNPVLPFPPVRGLADRPGPVHLATNNPIRRLDVNRRLNSS